MDRLVVLVPAWNSQYFPAPNSLLNLLTMNPLNSQFHSVIFTAIATTFSPPVSSYVDEYREMLFRTDGSAGGAGARLEQPVLPRPPTPSSTFSA
jgi:hypothetical protein